MTTTAIFIKTESGDEYLFNFNGNLNATQIEAKLHQAMGDEYPYIAERLVEYSEETTVKPLDLKAVRQAVADYMKSEGCSCCRDSELHSKQKALLAKLLKVGKYKDGSGYNFEKYQSK